MILGHPYFEKLDRIHPYPAKFPADIAEKYILEYTKETDLVFDPFAGSGSTLLAATANRRYSIGTDINGTAILISKFKLLNINDDDIKQLQGLKNKIHENLASENYGELYSYPSINHWFSDEAIIGLSLIKNTISNLFRESDRLNTFSRLAMSAIINQVSNQESDTRYAAITKEWVKRDIVVSLFCEKLDSFIKIVSNCKRDEEYLTNSNAILWNSKKCHEIIQKESVDFIITSPPYPNTYDYYLYHKHRMLWLDDDFKHAMQEEIGSRREFSSLKHPKEKFDEDLYEILYSCNIVLKPNAKVVIIIGDGTIQGELYNAYEHTLEITNKLGWTLIHSSFTELDKTTRSFRQSFRTKGKKEHVLIFEKGIWDEGN